MYFLARWFKYTSVLYLGLVYISLVACIVNGDSLLVKKSSVSYLQTQSVTVSSLQNNLGRSLQSRNIALDPSSSIEKYNKKTAVCESTIDKEIECRLSLTPAPIGSKCIAPCACSGSQRWVQFATINKLRRKEPSQWITCKTCLQPFDFKLCVDHGGVTGNVISALLDKRWFVRSLLLSVLLSGVAAARPLWMKFLVSSLLWQQYPLWNRLVHAPILMKFWGGRLLAMWLWMRFVSLENRVVELLAGVETAVVEPLLPITEA